MKLEQQVVNLELSKRLKELGVKQDSLWYWAEDNNEQWILLTGGEEIDHPYARNFNSAYSVAELGELIPSSFYGKEGELLAFTSYKVKKKKGVSKLWVVFYEDIYNRSAKGRVIAKADTEANARALAMIWLIENKHINP